MEPITMAVLFSLRYLPKIIDSWSKEKSSETPDKSTPESLMTNHVSDSKELNLSDSLPEKEFDPEKDYS
jgi:hypothetical protein